MAITNIELIHEGLSTELKGKIHLFLCNTDLSDKEQKKFIKFINKSFNEGGRKIADVASQLETLSGNNID